MRSAALLPLAATLLVLLAPIGVHATYTNPVVPPDHPDPGVLHHKGAYYAVTTSGDADNAFPILVQKKR